MDRLGRIKRVLAWPSNEWLAKQVGKGQDQRLAAKGLDEGCLFCTIGPWAWAYPMRRSAAAKDGDLVFPAYLPVCDACHGFVERGDKAALETRLTRANPGRAGRRMREVLPAFLDARQGPALPRSAAPHLDRQLRRTRWAQPCAKGRS